jgi:DNA-binding transcriptional LysR family regulator
LSHDAHSLRQSLGPTPGLALPHVEERELRYFVAVAEELHFTRAAERLGISQPPVSAAVSRLETKLGTTLLTRDSRNVSLTPPGEALLEQARLILREFAEAVDAVRDRSVVAPTLRLSTTHTCRLTVLPAFERLLSELEPTVALDFAIRRPSLVTERVRSGASDFGVVVRSAWESQFGRLLLHRVPVAAVVTNTHPLAALERVRPGDLLPYPLAIWPEEEPADAHLLAEALLSATRRRKPFELLASPSELWERARDDGVVCLAPADLPLARGFVSRAMPDVETEFETWIFWNGRTPPPYLDQVASVVSRMQQRG